MLSGPESRSTLRICMITGSYPPRVCGIGDFSCRLVGALSAGGLDGTVVTSGEATEGGWPLVSFGSSWGWNRIRRLVEVIRDCDPHVVHLQYQLGIYAGSAAMCFLPALVRAVVGRPVVVTFHDLNGPVSWGRLGRLGVLCALAGCKKAIVCSGRQYSGLRRLPIVGRKVTQIPVGPTVEPAPGWSRGPHKGRDHVNILCLGFVWRNRGLESVIDACAVASASGVKLRLTFAGGIVDGGYADELLAMAAGRGMETGAVSFTGEIPSDEMSRIMAAMDFAVLPFPTGVSTGRTTFMSCVAHGLPVVTTYDPANCPQELEDRSNVLLYPPGDVQRLADLITDLASDWAMMDRLGDGIAELAQTWNWQSISGSHADVYRSLARL